MFKYIFCCMVFVICLVFGGLVGFFFFFFFRCFLKRFLFYFIFIFFMATANPLFIAYRTCILIINDYKKVHKKQ